MVFWVWEMTIPVIAITLVAAVAAVVVASRPKFASRDFAKSAKIAVLSAFCTVILIQAVLSNLVRTFQLYDYEMFTPQWRIVAVSQGFFVLAIVMLASFAVGAVLGLVVALLASVKKPKRRILQCLAVAYSVVVILITIFAVIAGFLWSPS